MAVVQGLYRQGFRVIAHDVNTHVSQEEGGQLYCLSQVKTAQDGYFTFFDVVLMKDNVWNHLDTPVK